jgi:chromosome segregation ATPase
MSVIIQLSRQMAELRAEIEELKRKFQEEHYARKDAERRIRDMVAELDFRTHGGR